MYSFHWNQFDTLSFNESICSVYNVDIQCVDTTLLCVFCLSHLVCVLCSCLLLKLWSVSLVLCSSVRLLGAHLQTQHVFYTQDLVLLLPPWLDCFLLSLLHFELLDIYLALTSLFCRVNIYPHSYLVVGLYLFFIFPSETTFLFPKALPEYFFSACVWVMSCLISICPQSLYFAFTFEEYFCWV